MIKGRNLLDRHLRAGWSVHRRDDHTIRSLPDHIQHLVGVPCRQASLSRCEFDSPTLNLTLRGSEALLPFVTLSWACPACVFDMFFCCVGCSGCVRVGREVESFDCAGREGGSGR